MATIKDIERHEKWGKRPTDNTQLVGHIWLVEKGEDYDLVNFSINELEKYFYWNECLCVPCYWTDEQVRKVAERYAQECISEKEIESFKWFLEMGEKWGWD